MVQVPTQGARHEPRHIVNIRGNSYRMRQHVELFQALNADYHETDASTKPNRSRKRREALTP